MGYRDSIDFSKMVIEGSFIFSVEDDNNVLVVENVNFLFYDVEEIFDEINNV